MKCRSIQPLLDEYVSGTLPENDREGVRAHLAACARCSADLRMIERFRKETVREAEWTPSTVYFSSIVPRVREKIESRKGRLGPAWAVRFVLPAAAVVVLMIAVTWFTPRQSAGTSDSAASFTGFSNDELQDFMERQDVVGLKENTFDTSGPADEIAVLKDIVQNDHILVYSDFDNEQEVDAIAGRDADKVVAVLESGSPRIN
jgi:hypothetical protein